MKFKPADLVRYYNYAEDKIVLLRIDQIIHSPTIDYCEYMVYNVITDTYTFYPINVLDRWFSLYIPFKSKLQELL